MSAVPCQRSDQDHSIQLRPMVGEDVDDIIVIERSLYSAPWTPGNFLDCIAAGYSARVMCEGMPGSAVQPAVIGYFVLMAALDEAHLLNLSVVATRQRSGLGLFLLEKAATAARDGKARSLILEVRPSNSRAIAVYLRYGFREVGLRRGYYPTSDVAPAQREDAIVMRCPL